MTVSRMCSVLRPSRSSFHTKTVSRADVLHECGQPSAVIPCTRLMSENVFVHARRFKCGVLVIERLRNNADARGCRTAPAPATISD